MPEEIKKTYDFVDEDAKQLGFAFLFVRYVLPLIVGLILILIGILAIPFLLTAFPDVDFREIGGGLFVLLVLILILAINARVK